MSLYDGTGNDMNIVGFKTNNIALKVHHNKILRNLKQKQKNKQKKMMENKFNYKSFR